MNGKTLGQIKGEVELDSPVRDLALPNMKDVQRDLATHGYSSLFQHTFGDGNIATLWLTLDDRGDQLLTICRKPVKMTAANPDYRATEVFRVVAVTPQYIVGTLFEDAEIRTMILEAFTKKGHAISWKITRINGKRFSAHVECRICGRDMNFVARTKDQIKQSLETGTVDCKP